MIQKTKLTFSVMLENVNFSKFSDFPIQNRKFSNRQKLFFIVQAQFPHVKFSYSAVIWNRVILENLNFSKLRDFLPSPLLNF